MSAKKRWFRFLLFSIAVLVAVGAYNHYDEGRRRIGDL